WLRVPVPIFGRQLGCNLGLERGRQVIGRLVLIELGAMRQLAHRKRRALGQIGSEKRQVGAHWASRYSASVTSQAASASQPAPRRTATNAPTQGPGRG